MRTVTRLIRFCYGHRLMEYAGKCRHPHGHNGLIEITVRRDSLDALGMVMDFDEIKQKVQVWVDSELDHKMLLREDDPLVKILRDMGEPVITMKTNPTAESIAQMVFEYAQAKKVPVTEVKLWETDNSFAVYGG